MLTQNGNDATGNDDNSGNSNKNRSSTSKLKKTVVRHNVINVRIPAGFKLNAGDPLTAGDMQIGSYTEDNSSSEQEVQGQEYEWC